MKGNLMTNIPQPHTLATDFTLLSGQEQPVRLSDYRGKNVLLVFYPADWSRVCTGELSLIQELLEDIRGYNAEVLAISVDNHYSHKAWAEKLRITYPLLSDFWPHGAVAQQYGIFDEKTGVSERALFFIDQSGMIRDSWVAEDLGIAPSSKVIINGLKALHQGQPQEVGDD
jgi:peroxiredoxin